MADWVRAQMAPHTWEGKPAWVFLEHDKIMGVDTIPVGYSRTKKHCDGIWYLLIEKPLPPPPTEKE